MSPVQDYNNPSLFDDATDPQGSLIPQVASSPIPVPNANRQLVKLATVKTGRTKSSRAKVTPESKPTLVSNQKTADGRDEPAYLSVRKVAKRYSVSVATIWRWAKTTDRFPKPIELSPGTTRWAIADLLMFEQRRRGL
ncbi:MAG: AlpA family phage regulatory protein [Rhizobiaceae bacterium]|nr:AlpA family phage regulatory protein [Rhizobiaceae bacterium]